MAKFDVQGYEYKAIRGLSRTMNRTSVGGGVDFVYYEVDRALLQENADDGKKISSYLLKKGYTQVHSDRRDLLWKDKSIAPPEVSPPPAPLPPPAAPQSQNLE